MLPPFKLTRDASRWIANQKRTAKVIRLLWDYSSVSDRRDPEFLMLLVRCAWVNGGEDSNEAGRRLRNRFLAAWLDIDEAGPDANLVKQVVRQMDMPPSDARWLVSSFSGITHYYKAFRGHFRRFVMRHDGQIAAAFDEVSRKAKDPKRKARNVAARLLSLPEVRVATGNTSVLNGITPALACLDPQHRFPIVNHRTKGLLAALGQEADAEGVMALSDLVGRWRIKTAFHLDVYSQLSSGKFRKSPRAPKVASDHLKMLGLMSELKSSAILAKRKVIIRKRHNVLTNKLMQALSPPFTVNKEVFDALVQDYRKGRKLLIEAKSESEGLLGRTQIRQAIGQLFDYRWREFPKKDRARVDLALLTFKKPPEDMLDLLHELGIEALWFERKRLAGTIMLV